jgi:outer membrane protein
MKLRLVMFILALSAIAGKGIAQDTEKTDTLKLSLLDVQNYALEFNRDIKSAKIDVELAKKKVWETTTIGLPNITLSADYQHLFVVPEMSLGTYMDFSNIAPGQVVTGQDLTNSIRQIPPVQLGVRNNTTFTLQATQLIFSGEYIVGLQASRIYKELSEKSLVSSELKTRETVSTSYYLVLVIDENINILNESVLLLSKTLNEITKMHEQGYTEDTDVDQMKINLSTLESSIISLEGQKKVACQLLKLQMGLDIDKPILLKDSIDGIISLGAYKEEPVFSLQSSINYQMLETQEGLMSLNLKREKWKFLPTLAAFYQHTQLLNEPDFNFTPKDIVGVSVNIPIFTSGQRFSKVKQAQFELEKTQLMKEQASAGLILEFNTALNTYQTAQKNYNINKENMELSHKIYNKSLIKFKEGIISSLDLTQSQNQYLTTQGKYYSSVMEFLNAKAALDRILSSKNQ